MRLSARWNNGFHQLSVAMGIHPADTVQGEPHQNVRRQSGANEENLRGSDHQLQEGKRKRQREAVETLKPHYYRLTRFSSCYCLFPSIRGRRIEFLD